MLSKDVQEKIIKYCESKEYVFSRFKNTTTILYVEGMSINGDLNSDNPNEFNDIRCLFDHNLNCIAIWEATTEPGRFYTINPMNPKGAARICFGQYQAWQVGTHGNSEPHEALVQVGMVTVCRDLNKDYTRIGDTLDKGYFGINQHWGYDLPKHNLGRASAGCLVGRTRQGHREFMKLIKSDQRYQDNKKHLFSTIIIPGDKL